MEHVRNEELLPFHKLTEEEQETIQREVKNGNVEYLDINLLWYTKPCISDLFQSSIYRTISQKRYENMQHEKNNRFPWHMVDSKWNAVARDGDYPVWYLYKEKPIRDGEDTRWWPEFESGYISLSENAQGVIGVDMSKWSDIPWNESLMLRPGYEQQDTVEPIMGETTSDEEAPLVSSGNTAKEYPVVKLKNLHKLSVGDIVRLKKTGELIEVGEYSEIGCSGCKFSAYIVYQHPCRKCGLLKNVYVDYKEPTETQDETFANTEMKVYADLDDKTKQLLQVKQKEGKVEWLNCRGNWSKKNKVTYQFHDNTVYRVV